MSQQINLFNSELVKTRSLLTALNLVAVTLFSLVLVLAVWGLLQAKLIKLQTTEEQAAQSLATLEKKLATEKANAKQPVHDPELANELKALQLDIANRERALGLLGENKFGNTLGYSDYLVAFARQIPSGVWITGFSLEGAGDVISVHGRALQGEMVPVFLSQLKREKIMQGKTFAALDMKRPPLETLPNGPVDEKKRNALAPYIEFDLHSIDARGQKELEGKRP